MIFILVYHECNNVLFFLKMQCINRPLPSPINVPPALKQNKSAVARPVQIRKSLANVRNMLEYIRNYYIKTPPNCNR